MNGSYACGSSSLLTRDLRGKMRFGGWVMSDWWGVHASRFAKAGCDQDMPGTDNHYSQRSLGPLGGKHLIRRNAQHIVRGMLVSGAWDEPPKCAAGCDCAVLLSGARVTSDEHQRLARRVAAASIVLLKNRGGLLPLCGGAPRGGCRKGRTGHGEAAAPLRVAIVGSACSAGPISVAKALRDWRASDYFSVGGSGRSCDANLSLSVLSSSLLFSPHHTAPS